jgi:hypothetical protein
MLLIFLSNLLFCSSDTASLFAAAPVVELATPEDEGLPPAPT